MNVHHLALIPLAMLIGAMVPVQAGANVTLSRHLPSTLHASLANFAVGLAVLVLATGVLRPQVPDPARLAQAPWWGWSGGVLGAGFVLGTVLLAPRMGPLLFLAALVAGQLASSALLDHFGMLGFAVKQATPARIGGVILVLAGVVVIRLG